MEIHVSELKKHLDNANSRFQNKAMEIDELCEIISNHSAKSLMSLLREVVTTQETFSKEEMCKLLCVMWVLRDIGLIKFSKKADGLAITIQEMLLSDKKIIASTLLPILEDMIEHLSENKVTVIR